jgi:hypothetical protein
MMTLYQQSTIEERERILTTFRTGYAMCRSALFTLLYAIATFLLVIVHVLTFIINFAIGVLTLGYGLVCMARLLLVQLQELALLEAPAMIGTRGRM